MWHLQSDTVLERAARVAHLELGEDARRLDALGQALAQLDQRRVAHSVQVVAQRRRYGLAALGSEELGEARQGVGCLLAHDLVDAVRELLLQARRLEVRGHFIGGHSWHFYGLQCRGL